MINRKCKIGKKAQAARRIAAVLMTATLTGTIAASAPGMIQVSAATWSENADYIFEVLTRKLGYSEAAACGIMANIRCESTFNPHAWNAGGGSYGLCQWTGGRYGRLQSWCRSNGYDYKTIDGQLAYLEYELKTHYTGVENYLRSVENTSAGAYDAGQYYCYHFEAPASRGSVSVYRGQLASGTFWPAYRPAEWYFEDGVWRYIKSDGTYHTSWLTIENKTYYLDKNGNRVSGWKTIDGSRYYFDKDGVMATGWKTIDGKNYFFEEDGQLITGLVMKGEGWYMLDDTGKMQASAEMDHFATAWVGINGDQSLASAEDEKTEDASGEEQVALASSKDPQFLSEASKTAKKTASSGILGLASAATSAKSAMPSVSAAVVTVEEDTEEETVSAEASTSQAAEAADLADTAETVALAGNSAETAENAQDEAQESDTEADSAFAGETSEEAEEEAAELSGADFTEEKAEEETADTATSEEAEEAEADNADNSAQEAEEASEDAQTAVTDDAAAEDTDTEEAAESETEAPESAQTAATEEAQTADTEEAQEDADQGSDTLEAQEEESADTSAAVIADIATIGASDKTAENYEIAGIGLSEEMLRKQASEIGASEILELAPDEFAAADAMREAAQAQDEGMEEEENSGFFMIYDPQADEESSANASTETIAAIIAQPAETTEAADAADAEDTGENSEENNMIAGNSAASIEITLSDTIPFVSLEELDDLAVILDEQDILSAVTNDGKDITDQIKVSYEKIDPRGNAYEVTFTATYKGKTETLEATAYVNN